MEAYSRPLVQALLPGDIDKRVKWAEDYLEAAVRDFTYPDYILWTDEAIFHLDGHVNRYIALSEYGIFSSIYAWLLLFNYVIQPWRQH